MSGSTKRYGQHGLRLTGREGLFSLLIERTLDIKYRGIIWVGIHVENLEVAINFYEKTLGLPLVRATDDAAHFDVGSGALLELFSGGKSSPEPKGAYKQSSMVALPIICPGRHLQIQKAIGLK